MQVDAGAIAGPDEPACRRAFVALHRPALERDEARHNLVLGILENAPRELHTWTLGAAGQCAIQFPGRPLVLGELDRTQCRALADATRHNAYTGVVGLDRTAHWFVAQAVELGANFSVPVPQIVHSLADPPVYPGVRGEARAATAADAPHLLAWLTAFGAEAVPHDPPPDPDRVALSAREGRYLLWCVGNEPVSMAGIMRRTRHAAAIAAVYTPPEHRARGYAGSVVAATVDFARSQGKPIACLYTDARNPASNRCYAKIGFQPICESWHYPRILP
jgi:RimJ/RimL family protein N-acetyltransferase